MSSSGSSGLNNIQKKAMRKSSESTMTTGTIVNADLMISSSIVGLKLLYYWVALAQFLEPHFQFRIGFKCIGVLILSDVCNSGARQRMCTEKFRHAFNAFGLQDFK